MYCLTVFCNVQTASGKLKKPGGHPKRNYVTCVLLPLELVGNSFYSKKSRPIQFTVAHKIDMRIYDTNTLPQLFDIFNFCLFTPFTN